MGVKHRAARGMARWSCLGLDIKTLTLIHAPLSAMTTSRRPTRKPASQVVIPGLASNPRRGGDISSSPGPPHGPSILIGSTLIGAKVSKRLTMSSMRSPTRLKQSYGHCHAQTESNGNILQSLVYITISPEKVFEGF